MDQTTQRAARILTGVALGSAIAVALPPLGLALGLFGFFKSAKRFANNPHDTEAGFGLLNGYSGLVGRGCSTTHDSSARCQS